MKLNSKVDDIRFKGRKNMGKLGLRADRVAIKTATRRKWKGCGSGLA